MVHDTEQATQPVPPVAQVNASQPPVAAAGEPPRKRQPYVKPSIWQLHHMVDQHVSLAAGCKTVGSVSGPALSDCKTSLNAPCASTTS